MAKKYLNRICFINGSPKRNLSCSSYLIKEISNLFDDDIYFKEYFVSDLMVDKKLFDEILSYKKIVFVFPLYVDSIPSNMFEFMIQLHKYLQNENSIDTNDLSSINIYSVVNCGFLESEQTKISLNIVENYCKKVGFIWRYGLGIGGGAFLAESQSMPLNFFIKKPIFNAILFLKNDLENNANKDKCKRENIYSSLKLPKKLFMTVTNNHWKTSAKANGLKNSDLFKKI